MKQQIQIEKIKMQHQDDDVQVRTSPIDGWAHIEIFLPGRRVRTISLGPRGGIKNDITERME